MRGFSWIIRTGAASVCVLLIFITGCTAPDEAKLPLNRDGKVVVTVNGKNLTRTQMHRELLNLYLTLGSDIPPEQLKFRRGEFELQAIQNLINTELLVTEANRRSIRVPEDEIQEQIRILQQAYQTGIEFQKELDIRKMTPDELREEARRAILVDKLIQEVLADVPDPDEQEIETFYMENQDKIRAPEQVHASHILIQVLLDDGAEVLQAKRRELERIRERIRSGEAFEEAARRYSDCPSSNRGGDLGWFSRDQMAPSFSEAAFSTAPGDISDIVRTEFGLHIINVHDIRPARQASLEDIRADLGRYLHDQRKKDAVQSFIESIRERADIEINELNT